MAKINGGGGGGSGAVATGSSAQSQAIAEDQTNDATEVEGISGDITKQGRQMALDSMATKMADAQTARNAKQLDAMNQI